MVPDESFYYQSGDVEIRHDLLPRYEDRFWLTVGMASLPLTRQQMAQALELFSAFKEEGII